MKLSIVTTLYHSAPYLEEFHRRICTSAEKVASSFEILFVNDGSPDDSLERALRLQEQDPRVRILDLSRNFGHHKAIMTGLMHARGELVFLIDADLEEEPELLLEFRQGLTGSDVDVVYGVQDRRRRGFLHNLLGSVFYRLYNFLADAKIPQDVLTARLMTRRYVDALVQYRENEVEIGGLWSLTGFRQIPLVVHKHWKGSSTYTLRRRIALAVRSVTAFSNKPLVVISGVGAGILLLSFLYFLYILYVYLFVGKPPDGFTSLILSVWFLGGLTIFCLGVIAIYVSVIFVETKNRPYTIVRRIYEGGDQPPGGPGSV